jgi:hypothetical protein
VEEYANVVTEAPFVSDPIFERAAGRAATSLVGAAADDADRLSP